MEYNVNLESPKLQCKKKKKEKYKKEKKNNLTNKTVYFWKDINFKKNSKFEEKKTKNGKSDVILKRIKNSKKKDENGKKKPKTGKRRGNPMARKDETKRNKKKEKEKGSPFRRFGDIKLKQFRFVA